MADSGDEFRGAEGGPPRGRGSLRGARAREPRGGAGEGGGGRKRRALPGSPAAKRRRGRAAAAEEEALLVALALSRSLQGEAEAEAREGARKGRRGAEKRRRRPKGPCSPPPLLLQDPGKARRQVEARVARLLLPETGEAPSTPPLPASRLRQAQRSGGLPQYPPGLLWELSSLTGESLPETLSAAGFPLLPQCLGPGTSFLQPGPMGLPGVDCMPCDPEPSQAGGSRDQSMEAAGCQPSSERILRDLMELAGEGLTLTQWNMDVGQQEGAGQELVTPGDSLNKTSTHLQEEEGESSGSPHQNLSLLATAFGTMVNNPHLSDVQFQVDSGQILYAHLFVLYARCPRLLEVADRTGFTVAEEGSAVTRRVLLHDVPGEAVDAFLKYLYAADSRVPCHLQSDVGALADRFGVWDLAAHCGSHLGFRASRGRGDCSGDDGDDDGEDRAETFEELLESMWLEEDEEAFLKSACQEGNSSETVDERELEKIYEFAATQQLSVPQLGKEREEEKEDHSEEKQSQGGRWAGCYLTSLKEVLEDPVAALETASGLEPSTSAYPPNAGKEGGPQEVSSELPQTPEKRQQQWQFLGTVSKEASALDRHHLESPASLAEGRGCLPEPGGLWSNTLPGTSLQPVQKVFSQDNGRELPGPTWPPKESDPVPSAQQRAALPENHLRRGHAPCSSASPHSPTGRGPSQTALEASCYRQGQPWFGLRAMPGNLDQGPIVVLDSDEECEFGTSVGGLGISAKHLGFSRCKSSSGTAISRSARPLWAIHEQDRRRLADSPIKSQELQRQSNSDEEGSVKGVKMLVPDTPSSSRPTGGSLPNTRLMPGLEGEQFTGKTRARPSPEGFDPRDPLAFSCRPVALSLPGSSASNSPSCLQDEVMVVEDSEEERESPGKERVPIWQKAAWMAEDRGVGSHLGSCPQAIWKAEDRTFFAEGCVPGSETAAAAECREREWMGEAVEDSDCSDILPLTQRSPPSPAIPTQTTPGSACQLKDRMVPMMPLTPMPPYSVMATPVLKKELKRFGVRALPRRQMVLKLKEIFQFTHQERDAESKGRSASSYPVRQHCPPDTLWESQQAASSRDVCGRGGQGGELHSGVVGSDQLKRTTLPVDGLAFRSSAGDEGCPSFSPASQESTGSSVAATETSILNHSSPLPEFGTSLTDAEEKAEEQRSPASQAVACEEGKLEAFRRHILSTPTLCRQVLLYQPIELAVLQAELKHNGIKIALGKLLDLLDAHCITFTTADARREKHQHAQQAKKRRERRR